MKIPWAQAALALLTALSVSSCGTLRGAASTTDDVARAIVRPGDDVTLLEQRLRAANGGKSDLDNKIANQLTSRPGVAEDLWNASSDVRGLACDAYNQGSDQILTPPLGPFDAVSAQTLLNRMRAETTEKKVAVQTLRIICEVAGLDF